MQNYLWSPEEVKAVCEEEIEKLIKDDSIGSPTLAGKVYGSDDLSNLTASLEKTFGIERNPTKTTDRVVYRPVTTDDGAECLDTNQAAKYLNEKGKRCHPSTMSDWRAHDEGRDDEGRRGPKFIRINGKPLYPIDYLDEFAENGPSCGRRKRYDGTVEFNKHNQVRIGLCNPYIERDGYVRDEIDQDNKLLIFRSATEEEYNKEGRAVKKASNGSISMKALTAFARYGVLKETEHIEGYVAYSYAHLAK